MDYSKHGGYMKNAIRTLVQTNFFKYFVFTFVVALCATLCFVLPDFVDNPIDGISGVLTVTAYIIALGVVQFLVLYIICIERHVMAVVLPIYSLLGTVVAYYRVAYHATITPQLLDSVFHTNAGEAAGVISWQLIVLVIASLIVSAVAIVIRFKWINMTRPLTHALSAAVLLMVYCNMNSRLEMSIRQRYPVNVTHGIKEYIHIEKERRQERIVPEYTVVSETDSIDVVLVLGEAMRADHLSLNGYERETCPHLSKRANVVTYPHIYSQHTNTASSLPHILTAADSIHPEIANQQYSLITCMKNAGFFTAWISNQDYGHSYTAFINEADTHIFPNADKSVFVFHPWYDTDLMEPVDSLMHIGSAKNLYVLHTIGSHWYYNNHVNDSLMLFTPTTTNRVVTKNTIEQVVNSYDNTALQLDAFLDALIEMFEDRTCIIFYQSDHGESLGEDGHFLHASGAEETKYPAAIVWYSDKYAQIYPDKVEAIKRNSQRHYHTDYVFYSLLSSVGIEANGNNAAFDITAFDN